MLVIGLFASCDSNHLFAGDPSHGRVGGCLSLAKVKKQLAVLMCEIRQLVEISIARGSVAGGAVCKRWLGET